MLRAIVLVLLAAPALWGCVSLDEYAALREAYNKLDKERTVNRAASQAAAKAAKNDLAKVSDELQRVQQEVKDLDVRLQKATQAMAELSMQLEATKRVLVEKEKAASQPKPAKPPKGKQP